MPGQLVYKQRLAGCNLPSGGRERGRGGGAYQKLGGDLEAVELKGEGGGGEASFWEPEFPFVLGRKDLCIQWVCMYVRVRV